MLGDDKCKERIKNDKIGQLLLGIYSEKLIIQKDACTPVLTAALFKIPKTWKQL